MKLWLVNHQTETYVYKYKKKGIAELQIEPNQEHLLKNLEGSIFARLFGWSIGRHGGNSSDVTLAIEDAHVIQTLMDDE